MVNTRDFWKSIFLANSWLLDLSSCLVFSAFFGAFIQVLADSSERRTGRILASIGVAWISYLIPYFVRYRSRPANSLIPSWVYMGVLGSVVYAFNFRLVYFFIDSWMNTQIPTTEEFIELAVPVVIRSFIFAAIVIPPLCVSVLLFFRLLRELVKALKSEEDMRGISEPAFNSKET